MKNYIEKILIVLIAGLIAAVVFGVNILTYDTIKDPKYRVESDLEPYLKSFVNLAGVDGIDLTYIYSQDITIVWEMNINDKSTNVATSFGRNKDKIIIVVNKERFYGRTEEGRKYVMFHELGHDVLNFEHLKSPERGMMESTAYTGFFKNYDRFDVDRQTKYLYTSLRTMFNRFKDANNKEAEGSVHDQ